MPPKPSRARRFAGRDLAASRNPRGLKAPRAVVTTCLATGLLLPLPARAGPPVPEQPYGPRQIVYDADYLARRPFRLGRKGRRKLIAVAATTVGLYLGREEIRDAVLRNRSAGRTRFLDDVRDVFGKGALAPTLAVASLGSFLVTRNPREKETALLLMESMAYSSAAAAGGSFVLATERPQDGDSIQFLDTDGRGVSLDAALAASIVEPLRRQYLRVQAGDRRGRRIWKRSVSAVLYGGAALTALQRMDQDKHWAPDVFLGVMGGLSIGKTLGDAHDRAAQDRRQTTLDVSAVPGGVSLGLRLDLPAAGRGRR